MTFAEYQKALLDMKPGWDIVFLYCNFYHVLIFLHVEQIILFSAVFSREALQD